MLHTPGGGDDGPPAERDPAEVAADITACHVSAEVATQTYRAPR